MAKPNYSFEKRQREIAKQKKKADKEAEKALKKQALNEDAPSEGSDTEPVEH